MRKNFGKYVSALIIVGLMTACGSETTKEKTATTENLIPTVYKQNCLSCHGSQLEGKYGPSLQTVGSQLTEEEIKTIISKGQGGMPAFGKRLDEDEIASISAWLSEKK
ncbi:cytochrome c [Paenibacillus sp. 2KB_20]|uniref:c-type cytochrome n=1 Tax=Paenibacillus sp. 2KB_20 TaxID=3232977 RepID=UPI003F9E9029